MADKPWACLMMPTKSSRVLWITKVLTWAIWVRAVSILECPFQVITWVMHQTATSSNLAELKLCLLLNYMSQLPYQPSITMPSNSLPSSLSSSKLCTGLTLAKGHQIVRIVQGPSRFITWTTLVLSTKCSNNNCIALVVKARPTQIPACWVWMPANSNLTRWIGVKTVGIDLYSCRCPAPLAPSISAPARNRFKRSIWKTYKC